jgi:hypothetical protein
MARSSDGEERTMRKFASMLILSALATSSAAWAQSPEIPTPQTARQALLEMFSIKGSGTFVKHLPAATLSALAKSGAMQTLQQYSVLASQFHASANQSQMETFEAGPVLLTTDDPKTGQKVEVVVEKDSLQGDEDNIELSFRTYKNKQLQRTPFMPRIVFEMKMESGVWTLNEILFSMRLPLTDPDFLKSVTDNIKPRTVATTPIQLQSQPTITFGNDPMIVAAMRTILSAENTYRNTYSAVGYTCTLSDLDGFGAGEANEHQAMLIASGLASGKKYGYVFTLSGCGVSPATSLHLAAAPASNSVGRRAFCADQSAAIRYSSDGNPETCFANGTPVQ